METNLDDDVTGADVNQNKPEVAKPEDVRVDVASSEAEAGSHVCASVTTNNTPSEQVPASPSANEKETARREVKIPEHLSRDIARIRAKFAANQASTLQPEESEVPKEEADKEVPAGLVSRRISQMGAADVTETEQVALPPPLTHRIAICMKLITSLLKGLMVFHFYLDSTRLFVLVWFKTLLVIPINLITLPYTCSVCSVNLPAMR